MCTSFWGGCFAAGLLSLLNYLVELLTVDVRSTEVPGINLLPVTSADLSLPVRSIGEFASKWTGLLSGDVWTWSKIKNNFLP